MFVFLCLWVCISALYISAEKLQNLETCLACLFSGQQLSKINILTAVYSFFSLMRSIYIGSLSVFDLGTSIPTLLFDI